MSEREIKGIIFDKDGTLFNYSEVWGPFIGHALDEIMMTFNIKSKEREKARAKLARIIGVGDKGERYPDGILFHHDKRIKATCKLFLYCIHYGINPFSFAKFFRTMTKDPARGIEKELSEMDFSRVQELFRRLSEKKVALGVVTNDTTSSAKTCFRCMGIDEYVNFLRTKESNCRRKPNPEAINQFCAHFSIKREEVAVVGDTIADMIFAANGKVGYAIAVMTGSGDKEALEKQSDVLYPSIDSLLYDKVLFPEL